MAPRKSVGRTSTATPARTTRATSAVAVDSSSARRTTRATSQRPAREGSEQPGIRDDVVNNPQLPELQTQQSYAYGSTKTPNLPEQLGGKDPTTLRQIADNIDDEMDDSQFQKEVESSPALGRTRQTTSRERSRVPAGKPKPAQNDKEARIAAWADSLDESQLDDIPEEDSSEAQDDATHKDTDPSSFPSVILDHSYNYERGLRKPRPAYQLEEKGPSILQRTGENLRDGAASVWEKLANVRDSVLMWLGRMGDSTATALKAVPDSRLVAATVTLLAATILVAAAGFLFCSLYTRMLCDPTSPSVIGLNLQKFCGSCQVTPTTFDFSDADSQDISKVTNVLSSLSRQIQEVERRLGQRIDKNQAGLEPEMDLLRQQHSDLSNHLHNMQYSQSSISSEGIASPLIPKINFFAPSNGAIIIPTRSSPTRARQKSFPLRFLLRTVGMTKYQANPPIAALEPWQDVGDCWCGPDVVEGQDVLRLAVTTREMIYPTELVVEHLPAKGSLSPGTAPRKLQLWADFSHVSFDDWNRLRLSDLQEGNVLSSRHAKLGEMDYDTSGMRSHVQSFRLDVNQHGQFHYAKDFTLRVKENYGASFSCLYRVRLHGMPFDAPADIRRDGDWFVDHGYESESD